MQKTYILHSDPGHGWLAVKAKELQELGILEKITPYSYMNGKTVYLEEDCDLSTFFEAYRAKFGVNPSYTLKIVDRQSSIRGYDSFDPSFAIQPDILLGQKWDFGKNGILEVMEVQGNKIYMSGHGMKYKVSKNKFFTYRPSLVENKESV